MIALKLWYDIRRRFYISLSLFALIAILAVLFFPFLKTAIENWMAGIPTLDTPEFKRLTGEYRYYINTRWFGEIEKTVLFGILLTLGGVMAEGRSRSALITLSLPVSRAQWFFSQFGVGIAAVFLLNLVGTAIVTVGGFAIGQPLSWTQISAGTILVSVAAAPYLALALLAEAYTRERLVAGILAATFLVLTNRFDYFSFFDPWLPESLMSVLATNSLVYKPLITILVVTLACLAAGSRKFQQTDF